ncbi:MAG: four helix bundle protein [Verrucomicrobia bacterium]|nr:four helix bundle protein [Verrucomicrobiota bacterium]
MHNFEELEVWKRASRLAVDVLALVEPIKLYGLRDQMIRSCISVPSNIAEGADRDSDREFRRFLSIAKGSAGELRTQLYIGLRANLFDEVQVRPLIAEVKELSSMIEGLRKRLRSPLFNTLFGWFF